MKGGEEMKIGVTVEQFNAVCQDFPDLCEEPIQNKLLEFEDDRLTMDGIGFLHTLVYTALHNYFGEDESEAFEDAYYAFSVLT